MLSVKSLSIFILLLCIGFSLNAQLEWEELRATQLPELTSMRLNSMDADENGIWIGSESGLMYWRAETKEFERISTFTNIPIKEVIYSSGWVFVLTKTGSVSRLEYGGVTANVFNLTPDGVQAVDISVNGSKVAIATSYSGVYVYTNELIAHYKPDSSFVSSTKLNCISWYHDLLYVGNSEELRCSNGEVYTDSSDLVGKQVYKLDTYLNYLYIATSKGVSTYNSLKGFGQAGGGQLNTTIVLNFSFDLPSQYISTTFGLLVPNLEFGNNTWNLVESTAQANSGILDVLEFDGKTFYGMRDDGLMVVENQDTTFYQETEPDFAFKEIFEWDNQLYGIANNSWLFQYDSTINRLKLLRDFTDFGDIYSTLTKNDGEAFLFFNQAAYSMGKKQWYAFSPSYNVSLNQHQTAVFHPETNVPSLILHNRSIYSLIDGTFRKIVADAIVRECNHRHVKQSDAGVLFYCEDEFMVWRDGGTTLEPINIIRVKGYESNTYAEAFINGDSPLYIDRDSMSSEYLGHQTILSDQGAYMYPRYVEFISNERAIMYGDSSNILNVYRLIGFSRAANFQIPIRPKNERFTFLDKNENLWLANSEKIMWSPIPETPKPANEGPLKIFPNPNYGSFTLEASIDVLDRATITITDLAGTIVDSRDVNLQAELESVRYDLPNLSNGVYIINLSGQGVDAQSRIVILNN